MSTKNREVIWGGQIMGAKMRAETARQEARKAARAADRAEAEAWSVGMEGYGGPAQPSPTIGQCLNGGYGWLAHEWQPLAGEHSRYRFTDPDAALCLPRDDRLWHTVVDRKADLPDALRAAITVVGKGLPAVVEIPVHLDDVPPPAQESAGQEPAGQESAGREAPAPEEEEVPQ